MSWVDTARQVVKEHQFRYVHPETGEIVDEKTRRTLDRLTEEFDGEVVKGAVVLDAFTASMLVSVFDALSPKNQETFAAMPLTKAVRIGWGAVEKSRTRATTIPLS